MELTVLINQHRLAHLRSAANGSLKSDFDFEEYFFMGEGFMESIKVMLVNIDELLSFSLDETLTYFLLDALSQ